MAKRMAFDLQTELKKAWDWLWAEQLRQLAEPGTFWKNRSGFLTATDLERRIRSAAAEVMAGVAYGTYQNYGGRGIRIHTGSRGSLLGVCRRWLLGQVDRGILRADHPSGKYTCTGLRFRPVGADLTESEQRSRDTSPEEKRRVESIRDFHEESPAESDICPLCHGTLEHDPEYSSCPRCRGRGTVATRAKTLRLCEVGKKVRPRSFCHPRSWKSGHDTTSDPSRVTCKRCLAILKKRGVAVHTEVNS